MSEIIFRDLYILKRYRQNYRQKIYETEVDSLRVWYGWIIYMQRLKSTTRCASYPVIVKALPSGTDEQTSCIYIR